MNQNVYLMVGTHKGAFLLVSDPARKKWEVRGPFHKGLDVNHVTMDTRGGPVLWACVNSSWFGSGLQFSRDFGETWIKPETELGFSEASGLKLEKLWFVQPGLDSAPNVLYAGVAPAALFKSEDGGQNWFDLKGLTEQPTREKWQPGMGGMMVHSLCLHPADPRKMWVAISAAGVFYTEDGGASWSARNRNVRADFMPDKYPEVGQCVHHLASHPAHPEVLYQQNHCGMYRSEDAGENWIDVGQDLPSDFGFPIQVHPHQPDTIFLIPEEGAEFRCPVKGEFAVYRSRNRGDDWDKCTQGLPGENAYLNVYRQGFCADGHEACGFYIGTSTGQIFFSETEGDEWTTIAAYLPPIFSVQAVMM